MAKKKSKTSRSTTSSSKKKTRKKTTKKTARKSTPRKSSSQSLGGVSTVDLQREIARRQRSRDRLVEKRAKLAADLAALDAEIAALGASGAAAGKRVRNEANLVDSLKGVLSNATMGVAEAADAVQRAGYRTSSPNFRTIVNQALLANKKAFRKVARGRYTARKG